MTIEPMHVMPREQFERLAAREVRTEVVAGRLVTFNTIILSESPDFRGEAARRRTMTLAGIAKEQKK